MASVLAMPSIQAQRVCESTEGGNTLQAAAKTSAGPPFDRSRSKRNHREPGRTGIEV